MKSKILTVRLIIVILLFGQNALSMNNVNSLTNLHNDNTTYNSLYASNIKNIEKNKILESFDYENNEDGLSDGSSNSDNDEDDLVDESSASDNDNIDCIFNDNLINQVLSDPDHSNQKLYQFKNAEIFGNIDVLQSKTLKIYTCGTVENCWNANIIGDDNRGIFLKGRSEHATYMAKSLSLLGPINALRLIPDGDKEILVFTNQEYVFNGITDWINKWKAKNWLTIRQKPVKYQKLWQELDKLSTKHLARWHKFRTPNENIPLFPTEDTSKIEEKILKYSKMVVDSLNIQRATFTKNDVEKFIKSKVLDRAIADKILKKIEEQILPVGIDKNGNPLYTGEKYKKLEEYVMESFKELSKTMAHVQCSDDSLSRILNKKEYLF